MTTSVYDGAQTAADILIGYNHYLRDEMVNMTDDEIHEHIKKLQTCVDSSHGPNRHQAVDRLIEICRDELDDRDLVRCLVQAGLIVGINPIGGESDE
ncbi:hypothetical protein [Siphovirus Jomon_CT89]|nr:hypothetical protein [Siphovirus Jomon_CT89]